MAVTTEAKGTEAKIVDVATRLFYEKGYHATSMRQIAAGVKIQAGSMYNHFASKQELLMRISYGTTQALYKGAQERVAAETDPEERLRAFVEWHVEFHAGERLAARVADEQLHALEPRNRRKVLKVRDAHEKLLRELLEEGAAKAGWKVADEAVIAFAIGTMCTQVDAWYKEDGRLSPTEIGKIFADFIISAFRAS